MRIEEARVWCDHLHIVMNNRRHETVKAAATRAGRLKVITIVDLVGRTTEKQLKVKCGFFCDMCEVWYCEECENSKIPDSNICVLSVVNPEFVYSRVTVYALLYSIILKMIEYTITSSVNVVIHF